jgi:hypothetical protein
LLLKEDVVTDVDPARRALDIEEIKQLKARYFRFIDTKQWRRLRGLFTDDAAFEGLWAGGESPDEFVASLSRNLTEVTSVHHGHMPEIVITGPDTARGIWAMQDYLEWEPGTRGYLGVKIPGQRGVFGYGHYEEEYRREGGEWKISFLRLTRLRIDPIIGDRPPQLGGWLPSSKQDWLQTDR